MLALEAGVLDRLREGSAPEWGEGLLTIGWIEDATAISSLAGRTLLPGRFNGEPGLLALGDGGHVLIPAARDVVGLAESDGVLHALLGGPDELGPGRSRCPTSWNSVADPAWATSALR